MATVPKRKLAPLTVVLSPAHLEAACRAYWEEDSPDTLNGAWAALPEHGKANVRARIRIVLAAVGLEVRD